MGHLKRSEMEQMNTGETTGKDGMSSFHLADPEGDYGLFTGTVNERGEAHGRGQLAYDDGDVCVGSFVDGALEEGAVYDLRRLLTFTVESGQWTDRIDDDIAENFPSSDALPGSFRCDDAMQELASKVAHGKAKEEELQDAASFLVKCLPATFDSKAFSIPRMGTADCKHNGGGVPLRLCAGQKEVAWEFEGELQELNYLELTAEGEWKSVVEQHGDW